MKKNAFLLFCIVILILICVLDVWLHEERSEKTENVMQEEQIRVLIRSDHFDSEYHDSIKILSEEGFFINDGNRETFWEANECLEICPSDNFFQNSDVLYLKSENSFFILPELIRAQENPKYPGNMEIHKTEEGLLLINELLLEEYLCGVVPSEMPPYYPEEALKAQAVCARTYARKQKEERRAAAFHADVDDSVSYQVYNNQPCDERTDDAVRDTKGVVLKEGDHLIDAWYYSTSCGMNFSMDLSSESVFAAFLSENHLRAYEAEEPWYRWETDIMLRDYAGVQEISVQKRNTSGRAEELRVTRKIEGIRQIEIIEGEYNIRMFLNTAENVVTLQDGSQVKEMNLLPSAFFIMDPIYEGDMLRGYHLSGGGYGHGNGMSQNGAKEMAKDGLDYVEILENYYGKGTCLAQSNDA